MKVKLWWDDPQTGVHHELVSALPITLGRDPSNTLVLNSGLVSRQHAELFADGDTVQIRDVSSTNGIKVNGKVVQQAVLDPGDSFKVGPFYFNWGFDYREEGAEDLAATVVDSPSVTPVDETTQLLPPAELRKKTDLGDDTI